MRWHVKVKLAPSRVLARGWDPPVHVRGGLKHIPQGTPSIGRKGWRLTALGNPRTMLTRVLAALDQPCPSTRRLVIPTKGYSAMMAGVESGNRQLEIWRQDTYASPLDGIRRPVHVVAKASNRLRSNLLRTVAPTAILFADPCRSTSAAPKSVAHPPPNTSLEKITMECTTN